MARTTGPVCRLCRRDGLKLFLKGTRCDTPKCAIERRDTAPGMNQARRGKLTDYGVHLARKAKGEALLRRAGAAVPRLFRHGPKSGKGNTGEALMSLLERRLDNIVHRLGFGLVAGPGPAIGRPWPHHRQRPSRRHSQLPGQAGRLIRVKNRAKSLQACWPIWPNTTATCPTSCRVTEGPIPEGRVSRLPTAEDISIPVQTELIVELCSK